MLLVIKAFEFMNMFGCIVIKHLSDDRNEEEMRVLGVQRLDRCVCERCAEQGVRTRSIENFRLKTF
jgi:hypothetical protein